MSFTNSPQDVHIGPIAFHEYSLISFPSLVAVVPSMSSHVAFHVGSHVGFHVDDQPTSSRDIRAR